MFVLIFYLSTAVLIGLGYRLYQEMKITEDLVLRFRLRRLPRA